MGHLPTAASLSASGTWIANERQLLSALGRARFLCWNQKSEVENYFEIEMRRSVGSLDVLDRVFLRLILLARSLA